MKIIKDGLYLCRAKTKTHYSRLSYFKVRLPKNGNPPRNLTTSTSTTSTSTSTTTTSTTTTTTTMTTTTKTKAILLTRPKVTGEKIIQVGHSLALECNTDNIAADLKFSWFLNEEPIIDQDNSLLTKGEVKESLELEYNSYMAEFQFRRYRVTLFQVTRSRQVILRHQFLC